jgi:hypothetical protein
MGMLLLMALLHRTNDVTTPSRSRKHRPKESRMKLTLLAYASKVAETLWAYGVAVMAAFPLP